MQQLYLGQRYDWEDESNAAIFIDLEANDAQAIRINEHVAQSAYSLEIENNAGTSKFGVLALATTTTMVLLTTAVTTGIGLQVDGDALTTGNLVKLTSNSADATARYLVRIHNDHTSAILAVPLQIVQDAFSTTVFKKVMEIAGITFYVSNGTTPNGALTGVKGDVCYFGDSAGRTFVCSVAGTTWAASNV